MGSEMCIRDRYRSCGRGAAAIRLAVHLAGRSVAVVCAVAGQVGWPAAAQFVGCSCRVVPVRRVAECLVVAVAEGHVAEGSVSPAAVPRAAVEPVSPAAGPSAARARLVFPAFLVCRHFVLALRTRAY